MARVIFFSRLAFRDDQDILVADAAQAELEVGLDARPDGRPC